MANLSDKISPLGVATSTQGALADSALQPDGDGSALTGIVAGLEWSRKIANYTTSNNDAVIADTSGGVWTLTLPASPSLGDLVRVTDGADWSANNLTVARNGSTIEGDAADMTMDIGGGAVDFVYDGTTWQIYAQVGPLAGNSPTFAGLTVDGNVGIGTSSPAAKLQITATAATSGEDLLKLINGADAAQLVIDTAPNVIRALTGAGDALVLGTASTERMRIDIAGNVGIGTSSPDSGTTLHVEESSASLGIAPTASAFLVERAGNVGMTLGTANTGVCSIFMGDTDSLTVGRVQYDNSDNALQFWSNSSERMRIDSAGNVGIGTSSPTSKLDVVGAISSTTGANFATSSGGVAIGTESLAGGVLLDVNSPSTDGGKVLIRSAGLSNENRATLFMSSINVNGQTGNVSIECNHPNNQQSDLVIRTGSTNATNFGTERVRINTSGASSFTEIISANKGITFPATQVASADANTLDDYEEGTFTPAATYSGTNAATHVRQLGRYVKIGRLVSINIMLTWSEATSTGNLTITGLPFACANFLAARATPTILSFGFTGLPVAMSVTGQLPGNTTAISIFLNDNAATAVSVTHTDTDQDMYITLTYEAA